MTIEPILGGVCAPKGFLASGVHCGIRRNKSKLDLAMIVSKGICRVGCTFTQNKLKGAPILVTKEHVADGTAQAIICNSGNANTCNTNGIEIAEKMCLLAAESLNLQPSDIIVASTGVIGREMPIEPIASGIPLLSEGLRLDGSRDAAHGIMTTDTRAKEYAYSFKIGDKLCKIGAIAKGSGMIHPNMATMLAFLTTDVNIHQQMLQKAVSSVVDETFNMVSVDGDTSTNDMLVCMANGLAENKEISSEDESYDQFRRALYRICEDLSKEIAADGEGAKKLLTCRVKGSCCKETAKNVAKSVITSSLFKTAMFGADANWGRILCAIGYTEGDFDISAVGIELTSKSGSIIVCQNGNSVAFSEEKAKKILLEDSVVITIDMKNGTEEATAWGCDLTYDYVKINGDYRA
ncbi:bifunctional glutamate N-acetyltransferase/amino-acid acetyltransferase ArgJ [Aminipila sp.]|uniref:bifunctional glutamate N-acetyltransferase/amino-acid acetyltransferase ArgJ n=1 Tax=Aminipila sp. TaxID=2060095 RepID=UPI00289CEA8E|nr:bifunctional glutamate N-acetyltransferase/amino-acid acetyltransferase ArgJ [Aminipila sp.]